MNDIRHPGKITEITPSTYVVEFVTESACAACHARGICGAADAEKGSVEVRRRVSDTFEAGEEVNIVLRGYLGVKAVGLCFLLPLAILLILLLSLQSAGFGELEAAATSLCVLAVYYLVLFLFRHRIEKSYEFTIEKKQL